MSSANLGPVPYFTVLDSSGNPVSGGKIYTYLAGTTTPQNTYTDRTAATPNANPVVADSSGRATIFFDDSIAYKLVVKDASDVTLVTIDNYSVNPVILKGTTLTLSGNGTVGGTFGVTGDFAVNTNKFSVTASSGNTSVAGTLAVTGAQTNSSTVTATRLIANVATGTAPLTITSTTPVANLTATPVTYQSDGTQLLTQKVVRGSSTLSAGTVTVTLTGNAVMTNSASYTVIGTNQSNANAFKIANSSASQFVITGTGTDVINWIIIGS